jgi:ATP-dependent Clp protease ATP-binding subunit ClpA
MIRRTLLRLAEKGFHLEMSDAGRQLIINDGIDIAQGARPLRGVTDNYVESAVSRAYLAGEPTSGVLVPLKPPLAGLQIAAK